LHHFGRGGTKKVFLWEKKGKRRGGKAKKGTNVFFLGYSRGKKGKAMDKRFAKGQSQNNAGEEVS